MENIRFFYLKIFLFLVVKFSIYLNRCVFVMKRDKETNKDNTSTIYETTDAQIKKNCNTGTAFQRTGGNLLLGI